MSRPDSVARPGGEAAARAARHVRAIAAAPRPAGGEAERAAREHCAAALRDAGFAVREEPFAYSALPGRWATPLAGAWSLATLATAGHLAYRMDMPRAALALLGGAGVALALGARWLARRGVLRTPALRARGTNLVAVRGDGVPRVWLVAHLDSKSQPVPMALRVAGVVATGAAWVASTGLAAAHAAGQPVAGAWPWVSAAGAVAALPVIACGVGARSPGAVDDASGVAAVLLAAAELPPGSAVGVLLTSAEELGLAGARAFAESWREAGHAPAIALNCDGVDDVGELTVMHTGGADDVLARVAPDVRVRRLLPGVLVDAVALADAGWRAVTVSRGTLATLARIHTPRDVAERLRGDGVASAAALLVALATALSPTTASGRRDVDGEATQPAHAGAGA